MTVYERSLFLVSTLFCQHVKESGKFKPWVLLRVTQTHEFWVTDVLIFRPLSKSNLTHTLTWVTPWIEYVVLVSVVMSGLWWLKLIFNGGFREENELSKSCSISMKSTNLQKKDTPILGLQGLWSLSWWALSKSPFVKMSSTIIK